MPFHHHGRPGGRRPAALLVLTLLLGLVAAAPAEASSDVLLVQGTSVRSVDAPGSELADLETAPSARVTIAGARAPSSKATKSKKKKKKKPPYDLAVVRRAVDRTSGSTARRTAARAALARADRVLRASGRTSQARGELTGLLKSTTIMARGRRITADRLPMLTETLDRNAQWWSLRRATGSGARVQFAGSEMVWQLYPGSGLQLQWLGTFGRGNFLYGSGRSSIPALRSLVDEALRLAVPRADGIAWEYFFPFGGGSPPWASGMAEATGIQVLARASEPARLDRASLLTSAKKAMGILKAPPPAGVAVPDASGTHFLLYSFSSMKVLNAMNQTVNGLYAYVKAAPDDVDARLLLLDGLRWLDGNVRRYQVGGWTRYALGGAKATVHYHTLARDFLRTLCSLLKSDERTPGGGPTGAFPSARICGAADTWTKDLAAR